MQKIFIAAAVAGLICLLLLIAFGSMGLSHLVQLQQEKDRLAAKNHAVEAENLSLYREIDRLSHDLKYIESVARKELGMVGRDEKVFKPDGEPGR